MLILFLCLGAAFQLAAAWSATPHMLSTNGPVKLSLRYREEGFQRQYVAQDARNIRIYARK